MEKIKFTSLAQAMEALNADKLGTVYVRATTVFIVTAFGSGTFAKEAYDKFYGKRPT